MRFMIAPALMLFGVLTVSQKEEVPSSTDRNVIDAVSGPVLYKAYCASCHGIRGKGDGPVAAQLKTPPPDLTRIAARNHGKFPRDRVERIIAGDTAGPDAHGTREMPVWGPIFSQIAWDRDLSQVRLRNLSDYIAQMQSR